jgi:hypothetical protein
VFDNNMHLLGHSLFHEVDILLWIQASCRMRTKEKITEENSKLLSQTIDRGKMVLEARRRLIETGMGSIAFALIDSLDENIFRTPEIFFTIILDLWKNLRLM